ncbi:MAG: hypothetical protein M1831_004848 [Alyxoria varia]|nr:MAG: hypothetical protein M1831_004848 [Alyxoria varia]
MGGDTRKWQLATDLLMGTLGPIMLYFLVRQVLSNTASTSSKQTNREATQRLQRILLDREAEKAEDGEEDEEDARYSDADSDFLEDSDAEPDPSLSRRFLKSKSHKRRRSPESLELTPYEETIASEVIHPGSIPVSFADVGGLDDIISDLQETVIFPLTMPELYSHSSSLINAPTGVLLFGPPGCGKTMVAKALAHESRAVFINVHISTLTEKWYGDSNKLVRAVFSLARKLAPAIIFIDEIDAVLGTRRSTDNEASGMVKAEFMTHWDGLASSQAGSRSPHRIMILGATNRIQDIDEAILRRMPKKYGIGLPNAEQRRKIFDLLLRDTKIDDGYVPPGQQDVTDNSNVDGQNDRRQPLFDLDQLVKRSHGFSGSDIRDICREAAMEPMRDAIRARKSQGAKMNRKASKPIKSSDIRGLRTNDFEKGTIPLNHPGAEAYGYDEAPGAGDDDSDGYESIPEEGQNGSLKHSTSDNRLSKSRPHRRRTTAAREKKKKQNES